MPGDCVHLHSYYDVVEVGHDWTRDPFGGELEGGQICVQGEAGNYRAAGARESPASDVFP